MTSSSCGGGEDSVHHLFPVNFAKRFRSGGFESQMEALLQDVCFLEGRLDGFDSFRSLGMAAGGVIFEARVMDQARLHRR